MLVGGKNNDIEYNLQLANLRIRDKMEPVNQALLLIWWRNFIRIFSVHTWAFITIVLSAGLGERLTESCFSISLQSMCILMILPLQNHL